MSEEQIDWSNIDNSIKEFSLNEKIIYGKVVSVYDGDSINVCFPFKGEMTRWKCRLSGIDTPELRSKNDKEKEKAYEVRDLLRIKILNQMVNIHCEKFDKYGRLLVRIFTVEDECVNDWLISEGHANIYYGGTKQEWKE